MNAYNVVLTDSNGAQQQHGVSASNWANAVIAAKKASGLKEDESTDESLRLVQWIAKLDVQGE